MCWKFLCETDLGSNGSSPPKSAALNLPHQMMLRDHQKLLAKISGNIILVDVMLSASIKYTLFSKNQLGKNVEHQIHQKLRTG